MASCIAIPSAIPRGLRPRIIGILRDADFLRLKRECPRCPFPDRYADWLDEREGLHIGLAAAGVKTALVTVDLARFLDWCRKEARPADEDALDRFAALTVKGAELRRAFASAGKQVFHFERPTERPN